jgi:hypothetical protein
MCGDRAYSVTNFANIDQKKGAHVCEEDGLQDIPKMA